MRLVRHIRRIGNSQGIILPKETMEALGWEVDSNVTLEINENKQLVVDIVNKNKPPTRSLFSREQ